jgi:hypothetical protein
MCLERGLVGPADLSDNAPPDGDPTLCGLAISW